ncbi:hypothetical protein BE17_08445 [Sorangium cellulosum]|uniref:Secreted protein n=1 Tax=Sorangium cellulosum TaxID=56 RepID=A0A150SQL9_SORCE|nr:hypothetical protein BE17_08445 [Sorangium cellulosum]
MFPARRSCLPLKDGWFGLALALAGALGFTGCAAEDPREAEAIGADSSEIETIGVAREHVAGDVYHYSFTLRVGHTPNARVRLHRVVREVAPWWPRPAASAVMLLHGDFATFTTSFAPGTTGATAPPHGGLAVYLAAQGVDVWGFDRRWTLAPADGADLSDFAAMGYAQELDDVERALAFARGTRAATGSGHGKLVLGGFSRGGHLAYVYAGRESQRAPGKRHVRGLVPIDIYARIAPEDEAFRQNACASSAWDQAALQQGVVDSDNGFQITVGSLAASDPGGASPYYADFTNRDVMLAFIAQTYLFFQPTPVYHLGGGALVDGFPTALRWSAEPVIDSWLAGAPFHQALAETADTDALWCGDAPLPLDDHLEDVQVPLFYLGAAGGFGDHGLYTTTLVASTDVTTHVVRRLAPAREDEDFGHGDLLYAADAVDQAWAPLAQWLLHH